MTLALCAYADAGAEAGGKLNADASAHYLFISSFSTFSMAFPFGIHCHLSLGNRVFFFSLCLGRICDFDIQMILCCINGPWWLSALGLSLIVLASPIRNCLKDINEHLKLGAIT